MIANKILPAFYIIELEGEAANLEFLLGQNFGIEHIRFGSLDYPTDLDATRAGQDALEFFTENPSLDWESVEEHLAYNPEFFPTLKPLELTDQQKMLEEIAQEKADESASPTQTAVVLTRHFDPLGDFVAIRLNTKSTNFKMSMKVCINPDVYLQEKAKDKVSAVDSAASPHRELIDQFTVH